MCARREYHFFVGEQHYAVVHGQCKDAVGGEVGLVSGVDEDVLLVIAIHQIALRDDKAIAAMVEARHQTARILHFSFRLVRVGTRLHQAELERPVSAFGACGNAIQFHELPLSIEFAIAREFVAARKKK